MATALLRPPTGALRPPVAVGAALEDDDFLAPRAKADYGGAWAAPQSQPQGGNASAGRGRGWSFPAADAYDPAVAASYAVDHEDPWQAAARQEERNLTREASTFVESAWAIATAEEAAGILAAAHPSWRFDGGAGGSLSLNVDSIAGAAPPVRVESFPAATARDPLSLSPAAPACGGLGGPPQAAGLVEAASHHIATSRSASYHLEGAGPRLHALPTAPAVVPAVSSARQGTRLGGGLSLAEQWVMNYAPPAARTPAITYPCGASVNFADFATSLAPVAAANAAHRARMVPAIQSGEVMRQALHIFEACDQDRNGFLSWNNGEIRSFITSIFQQHGLHPPNEYQLFDLYVKFDADHNCVLDSRECLCLADALLRSVFLADLASGHVQAPAHVQIPVEVGQHPPNPVHPQPAGRHLLVPAAGSAIIAEQPQSRLLSAMPHAMQPAVHVAAAPGGLPPVLHHPISPVPLHHLAAPPQPHPGAPMMPLHPAAAIVPHLATSAPTPPVPATPAPHAVSHAQLPHHPPPGSHPPHHAPLGAHLPPHHHAAAGARPPSHHHPSFGAHQPPPSHHPCAGAHPPSLPHHHHPASSAQLPIPGGHPHSTSHVHHTLPPPHPMDRRSPSPPPSIRYSQHDHGLDVHAPGSHALSPHPLPSSSHRGPRSMSPPPASHRYPRYSEEVGMRSPGSSLNVWPARNSHAEKEPRPHLVEMELDTIELEPDAPVHGKLAPGWYESLRYFVSLHPRPEPVDEIPLPRDAPAKSKEGHYVVSQAHEAKDPKVKVAKSKKEEGDDRDHYRSHPIVEFGESFVLEREQMDPNLVAFVWAKKKGMRDEEITLVGKAMASMHDFKIQRRFTTWSVYDLNDGHRVAEMRLRFAVCSTPGPVRNPQMLDVKQNEVTFQWTPPANDHGAPVTGYKIAILLEKYPNEGPRWFTVCDCTKTVNPMFVLENLTGHTAYMVDIRARNKVGVGDACEFETVTAAVAPEPPPKPWIHEARDGCLNVAWHPSTNDGGAAIMTYKVKMRKLVGVTGPQSAWNPFGPGEADAVWEDLGSVGAAMQEQAEPSMYNAWIGPLESKQCEYCFQIFAQNGVGASEGSEISDPHYT